MFLTSNRGSCRYWPYGIPEHIGYRQFFTRDNLAVIFPDNLHRAHPSPGRQYLQVVVASLTRDTLADSLLRVLKMTAESPAYFAGPHPRDAAVPGNNKGKHTVAVLPSAVREPALKALGHTPVLVVEQ
jgi:hypothetical protein